MTLNSARIVAVRMEIQEMSSTPFCLGIPVVDEIPPIDGNYVLRTKNYYDLGIEIRKLQDKLSTNDLIKIYCIGYRPDEPIPVSRYFTEISVQIGKAQKYHNFGYWYIGTYRMIATGIRNEQNESNKQTD